MHYQCLDLADRISQDIHATCGYGDALEKTARHIKVCLSLSHLGSDSHGILLASFPVGHIFPRSEKEFYKLVELLKKLGAMASILSVIHR